MMHTTLELKITKAPEDVSDAKNGDRLIGTVRIGGANHHLELIRVVEDEEGGQLPENEAYYGTYEDLQVLYSGKYESFEVPGQPGRYIAFMTPYDD